MLDRPVERRMPRFAPLALVLVLVALASTTFAGVAQAATASGSFTTQPALSPAFNAGVTDYVARCVSGQPVSVSITQSPNSRASVDNAPYRKGNFTASVNVHTGQEFTVRFDYPSSAGATYYVRCLPTDFAPYTFTRSGTPQVDYFVASTGLSFSAAPTPYVAIFDTNGVPMWWEKAQGVEPLDARVFANGNLGWGYFNTDGPGQPNEERRLDGSLVRTVSADPQGTDGHEFIRESNGNYLVAKEREVVLDMSACGGTTDTHVLDFVLQEVTPAGAQNWYWIASDHINPCEMDIPWRSLLQTSSPPYDVYHWNSMEQDREDLIISFRHEDAVYEINMQSGNILWKLGGTPTPQSLTVIGDPYFATGSGFGGQHDARILSDDTITIHDNQTRRSGQPRAVRYRIDRTAGTATLLEQVKDADVTSALCCGSARKLSGGDWLMGWGANSNIEELTPSGGRVFRLAFGNGVFSYRAQPVPSGTLTRSQLRSGMDAQYPR